MEQSVPPPTGERHYLNSVSLSFTEQGRGCFAAPRRVSAQTLSAAEKAERWQAIWFPAVTVHSGAPVAMGCGLKLSSLVSLKQGAMT